MIWSEQIAPVRLFKEQWVWLSHQEFASRNAHLFHLTLQAPFVFALIELAINWLINCVTYKLQSFSRDSSWKSLKFVCLFACLLVCFHLTWVSIEWFMAHQSLEVPSIEFIREQLTWLNLIGNIRSVAWLVGNVAKKETSQCMCGCGGCGGCCYYHCYFSIFSEPTVQLSSMQMQMETENSTYLVASM